MVRTGFRISILDAPPFILVFMFLVLLILFFLGYGMYKKPEFFSNKPFIRTPYVPKGSVIKIREIWKARFKGYESVYGKEGAIEVMRKTGKMLMILTCLIFVGFLLTLIIGRF